MAAHVLVVEQGTTSTRGIVFDAAAMPGAAVQQGFGQICPRPGWVEHDPAEIWATAITTAREPQGRARLAARDIAALGVANQRETVVAWDRRTGGAIRNAIVWQDRRAAPACEQLEQAGHAALAVARTGLRLDPYFSATKIGWLLDRVDGARAAAGAGHLAFGTVDSFLLRRLTDGAVHATDATNASRTLLFDIHRGAWDDDLLAVFGVPRAMLPEVRDSAGMFGTIGYLGAGVAIRGIAGDQQAALIGRACFRPGMVKSTYGAGCFALLHTGHKAVASSHRMLTTIAYQLDGVRSYALKGAIFVAGAAVQWLRDGLRLIASAAETGELAAQADFRADILGGGERTVIRVDGGMSASDWTMQFLPDMLAAPVDRPSCLETTVIGAACLAGTLAGVYPDTDTFAGGWTAERRFQPALPAADRNAKYRGWLDAAAQAVLRP